MKFTPKMIEKLLAEAEAKRRKTSDFNGLLRVSGHIDFLIEARRQANLDQK